MINRVVACLVLLTFTFIFSGCWDRREIEELAIISAIGIDIVEVNGEELFRVSHMIMRPGLAKGGGVQAGGGGGTSSAVQQSFYLVSATGKTLFDAGRNISARISRYQFAPTIMVIIIGEKLARQDAKQYMDFLDRHKEFRLRTQLFIVKGEALEALTAQPEFETSLAEEISRIATNSQPNFSKGYKSDLLEILRTMTREGQV